MQKQSESETLAMREKIYMTVQESVIGAGTGNYNKLKNIPIVNLRSDSPDNCIVLAGLNPGTFILNGYYKVEESSEVSYQGEPVQLHCVTEDSFIGTTDPDVPTRRVVYFIHFKNANLYVRMITFYGSEAESDFDVCLTQPLIYWDEDNGNHGDNQNDDQNGQQDPQGGGDDNTGGDQGGDDAGGGGDSGGDDQNGQNDQNGDDGGQG